MERRLTGRLLRRKNDGKWVYTSAEMDREETGLQTMKEYILQQKNTVAQYIAMQSLLSLCEGTERAPGARVWIRWWDQSGTNMSGAREAAGVGAIEEERV